MRILIATTFVPFVRGGAETQADELATQLRLRGHECDIAAVPFKWDPPERVSDHMLACRLLDVTESCGERIDRVIALKFPAYFISHAHKVLWLAHQYRSAYDGWENGTSELLHAPVGLQMRDFIRSADANALAEAQSVYTISKTVSSRLRAFCNVAAEHLYHPPLNAGRFHNAGYGDYLLMPSRVSGSKRQKLVIKAMELTAEPVRLKFIGAAEGPIATAKFRKLIASSRAAEHIEWLGHVTDDAKIEAYAGCCAVVFPPIDEDYGYITLEAMLSEKPIITCRDSGGPLEFIVDEESGLVCDPTPESLAAAMDELWRDRAKAERLGKAGRAVYASAGISWDGVIPRLLA